MSNSTNERTGLLNEVIQNINNRRAVRKFKSKTVERILIEQILNAGRMAPSALNKQPWRFYVLTEKESIHSISKEIAKVTVKHVAKLGIKEIVKYILHYIHSPKDFSFFSQSDFVFMMHL
ncbi:MAG: nitroreductase family protein [Bacteroidetes bacterium]|nr:nitroreductase family protein [Bacteroidota bacterium]